MATLINNAGVQHYANKMVLAENRKVGSKSLPTALNDIDLALDEMKNLFDAEYGSALDMKLENTENIFSVGTGSGVDKKADVENSFTDVELFGNSLVNLNKYSLGSFTVSASKYYTPEKSLCDLSQLKNNTDYTLIIDYDIKDGSSDRYNTCELVYADAVVHYGQNFIINNKKGVNVFKFTTRESFPIESTKLAVRFIRLGSGSPIEGEKVTADIKNVLLLEGDYTNKPIPNYFEGMKSVGESEGNKIEILSRNKNLFDENAPLTRGYLHENDGSLIVDGDGITAGNATTDYININYMNSVKIGFEEPQTFRYILYDKNKKFIKGELIWSKPNQNVVEINTKNAFYIRISAGYYNQGRFRGLMIMSNSSEYSNYIEGNSNKKEISLNEPLRGLPNGVKDTIEKVNGEWKIVRRCGEYRFDETSKWVGSDVRNNGHWIRVIDSDIPNFKNRGCLITTVEVFGDTVWEDQDLDRLGVWDWSGMNFYIFIPSKLSGWDVANHVDRTTISLFMKTNAINIIHELATPIIEDISPVTLQCWKNGTISIDSIIPAQTTHTVALNKPAQIKRNIEELTQLRNKVKSLEEQYDQIALEQAHQLELINHSFELDYI